jgi:hypothetical protein
MSRRFRVTWEIDLYANSPRAAAEQALAIQRDPESIATVFGVRKFSKAASTDSAYVRVFPDDDVIDLSKTRRRKKK